MPGAPLEIHEEFSPDCTMQISGTIEPTDGEVPVWTDYAVEYVLSHRGCPVLNLSSSTTGVATSVLAGNILAIAITYPAGQRLRGLYDHFCRARYLPTGQTLPVFGGTVNVERGMF